jgi:hypothetical protein
VEIDVSFKYWSLINPLLINGWVIILGVNSVSCRHHTHTMDHLIDWKCEWNHIKDTPSELPALIHNLNFPPLGAPHILPLLSIYLIRRNILSFHPNIRYSPARVASDV